MLSETNRFANQVDLINAALDGDDEAARVIQSPENRRRLHAFLVQRGASHSEAEEIGGDIWSEAFQSWRGKPPLLGRFDGKGDIIAFLGRCALNRLVDLKRRGRFRGDLQEALSAPAGDLPDGGFDQLVGGTGHFGEVDNALVDLLRESLVRALAKAPPQELLMIKLVTLQGIQQKTVAEMWGWSRSKVCRAMAATLEQIRKDALAHIAEVDPWLEVEWEDIVDLCAQSAHVFR
ncbi:MAG: sigma-70 family RNA polymerase sigma factor [Verrucomicrobiales bacterium]|nr:sigma-70 family RNA polymerase sigma factor [Verrucomicrobiales bacterium]